MDEAHKARGATDAQGIRGQNKLLAFMGAIAEKARHVLLGTATPIQTDPMDLWDLLGILGSGASHVLGSDMSRWRRFPDEALRIVRGEIRPRDQDVAWDWIRDPMPPGSEKDPLFGFVRSDLGMNKATVVAAGSVRDLDDFNRELFADRLHDDRDGRSFFQDHNPVLRHTVLRRRRALEEAGLMTPVAVDLHPRTEEPDRRTRAYFGDSGRAVQVTMALSEAFKAADTYTRR